METKWREAGGEGEFNCKEFLLTQNVLEQLINDFENDRLPYENRGFFFGVGTSPDDEEYQEFKKTNLELFERLLDDVRKDGATYVYDSWW